ncbi:hypothetical protein G9A89_003067 [Geosiphon pyriformis]|nr:hypothetical protein G9A89_003067 [Geosiphon pyriformis]
MKIQNLSSSRPRRNIFFKFLTISVCLSLLPSTTLGVAIERDNAVDSVSGNSNVSSVSGNSNVDSVPGNYNVSSVSGNSNVDSVPGNYNVSSVSGNSNVDSVPGNSNVDSNISSIGYTSEMGNYSGDISDNYNSKEYKHGSENYGNSGGYDTVYNGDGELPKTNANFVYALRNAFNEWLPKFADTYFHSTNTSPHGDKLDGAVYHPDTSPDYTDKLSETQLPPDTKEIDLKKSEKYAELASNANSAYCLPDLLYTWSKEGDAVKGLLGSNPQKGIFTISIRGPSTEADMKTFQDDELVDFENKAAPDAKVHKGFFNAWKNAKDKMVEDVKSTLEKKENANLTIELTGHSSGGVYAVLAALEIKSGFKDIPVKVFTYGQPRIGNDAFAKYVNGIFPNGEVYRITNTNDRVPRSPSTSQSKDTQDPKLTYLHHEKEYWISPDTRVLKCEDKDGKENPNCVNSGKGDPGASNLGPYWNTVMGECSQFDSFLSQLKGSGNETATIDSSENPSTT